MKVYVQSKSGNFNVTFEPSSPTLDAVLANIRKLGGYYVKPARHSLYKELFVPFEEIEYIAEETE